MLVMDSGLGGLSVVRAIRALAPHVPLTYLTDTAGFPYGTRHPDDIAARAVAHLQALGKQVEFSTVVLACNTLSTLCLQQLRESFRYRFVGAVPAIKVAAAQSKTRRFTLLATPHTARSAYSQRLIDAFASDCVVDCYGAPNLAQIAENVMLGKLPDEAQLRAELAPAFYDDHQGKTDAVILGCTHYPLILPQLQRVAPWDVAWIDASQAIARQALAQPPATDHPSIAYVTATAHIAAYAPVFSAEGFAETAVLSPSFSTQAKIISTH